MPGTQPTFTPLPKPPKAASLPPCSAREQGQMDSGSAQDGGTREDLRLLKAQARGGGFEAGCVTQTARAGGPWEKGELCACPPP